MNWPWEGYVALGLGLWACVRLGRIAEQLWNLVQVKIAINNHESVRVKK